MVLFEQMVVYLFPIFDFNWLSFFVLLAVALYAINFSRVQRKREREKKKSSQNQQVSRVLSSTWTKTSHKKTNERTNQERKKRLLRVSRGRRPLPKALKGSWSVHSNHCHTATTTKQQQQSPVQNQNINKKGRTDGRTLVMQRCYQTWEDCATVKMRDIIPLSIPIDDWNVFLLSPLDKQKRKRICGMESRPRHSPRDFLLV